MNSIADLGCRLSLMSVVRPPVDSTHGVADRPAGGGVVDLGRVDRLPVTFVILTKDEEANLPLCLDSLDGLADDIHVLDSGSRDGTAEVARSRGVPAYEHPFAGFGTQRNWASDNIPHQFDWAFHLDADERFTPELAAEIRRVLSVEPHYAGYYVPSKLMFGGRWLRRSGSYPAYQVRLFHRRRLRFVDHGHGQREVADGPIGVLSEPYLHDAFSKGLDDWFAKHVGYARREAEEHEEARRSRLPTLLTGVFAHSRIERRRALKRLSHRLPGRALLRFLEVYVLRRGFLEGPEGLAYARMLSAYEAMAAAYAAAGRCAGRPERALLTARASELSLCEGKPRRPR